MVSPMSSQEGSMTRLSQLLRRKSSDGRLIRTSRFVLRPLNETDLDEITRLAGDWAIASMTARIPYPYTQNDARQWLDGLDEGEFVRAITIPKEDRLLGITGYVPSADRDSAEIGYWVGKPYWGRGIATEAARAIVEHCFTSAGFKKLTCCHFADNPASARVIEKLGFTSTGQCNCWCEARRVQALAIQHELPRRGWLQLR